MDLQILTKLRFVAGRQQLLGGDGSCLHALRIEDRGSQDNLPGLTRRVFHFCLDSNLRFFWGDVRCGDSTAPVSNMYGIQQS